MKKHKRSKLSPMIKIWRCKVKRVPPSYTKIQERTSCVITNKQMTNLSINSPHQVETTSEHLEETMKIEEVPDTSRLEDLHCGYLQNQSQQLVKMMRLQQPMLSFKNCVPCNKDSNRSKVETIYNTEVRQSG